MTSRTPSPEDKKELENRLEHNFANLRYASPNSPFYNSVQAIILRDAQRYINTYKQMFKRTHHAQVNETQGR